MKIRTLKFYLQEATVSLFKNRLMTLASIATIASCVLLFIMSSCAILNINSMLDQIEATVGVSVFPVDDISEARLTALEQNLKAIPNVTHVRMISPEEALKSMEEDFAENKDVLEGFKADNPLSTSFEIKISSTQATKQVVTDIKKLEDVEKIREAEQLVSFLIRLSNILSIVSIVIVAILAVISIVIIVNTIKLTVYVRRKEINIMKFVGATDWFIRWPFVIEGVLIGMIGAIIPCAAMWFGYTKIVEKFSEVSFIQGLFKMLDTMQIFPYLAPICICAGAILGMSGSVYSVRKHLNV